MRKIVCIVLSIIVLPHILSGCSCYMTESFDLKDYDEAINIIEIEIKGKCKEPIQEEETYPPALPSMFSLFDIEIRTIYKGDLTPVPVRLKINKKSSCYWEPIVGNTYILYLKKQEMASEIETVGCFRKISVKAKNYTSEAKALRLLQAKKEGKFIIDQTDLLLNPKQPYYSVKGAFKKGVRHGTWIIAEPIVYSTTKYQPISLVIRLKYRNGQLKSVKQYVTNDLELVTSHHISTWFVYFDLFS